MRSALSPALDLLARLVGFPTISDQSNAALVRFVSEYLTEHGVTHHIFPDATGQKHGLIAHIGPQQDGGVILSGHTDVVPVQGQNWTSDPFQLTHRDGCYFGRGTCDMKGFLALALAAVPDMMRSPLVRPIQLAFSFDEEPGCLGTAPLLDQLATHFPRASAVLVGEPTAMQVVTGHKGGIGMVTRLHGKAAHSSRPDLGVSAITHAAALIDWHSTRMAQAQKAAPDNDFVPPFSTVQVGTIRGGVALNTVPDTCVLESDIRFLPTETADQWLSEYRVEIARIQQLMQLEHPDAHITLEDIEIIPAMRPEPNGAAEQLARQLTGDNSENYVSYQTEAGHFQAAGYATVVCGPGSIEQAHKPDEFISAHQLHQGQAFMTRLIDALSQRTS